MDEGDFSEPDMLVVHKVHFGFCGHRHNNEIGLMGNCPQKQYLTTLPTNLTFNKCLKTPPLTSIIRSLFFIYFVTLFDYKTISRIFIFVVV